MIWLQWVLSSLTRLDFAAPVKTLSPFFWSPLLPLKQVRHPVFIQKKKNWSKKNGGKKVEICGKISDGFQFSLKRLRDRTYKVIRSFFISTNVSQVKTIWAYYAYFRNDTNVYWKQYWIRNVRRNNQNVLAISVVVFSSVWSNFVIGHIKWFHLSLFQLM